MQENEQPQPNQLPTDENPTTEQFKTPIFPHKLTIVSALAVLVVIAIVAFWFFNNQNGSGQQIVREQEQEETDGSDSVVELKIIQGETLGIPGTDVKIKAVSVSETCTHVPPPDCGDEATLEFSHTNLSSTYSFTLRRPSQTPSEETYTFFGHKITVTDVRDKEATLVVEIQKEIPGNIPGWLIARNSEAGFELQHPRIFEFEDKGQVTPAPQLYYNHWVIIRAPGQEFPEHVTILIYNNVNQSLSEFANSHIFPGDTTPESSTVGSKKVMESVHTGLDGETINYFWLDSARKRGAIFGINPAKPENLSDFHKVVESFEFTK